VTAPGPHAPAGPPPYAWGKPAVPEAKVELRMENTPRPAGRHLQLRHHWRPNRSPPAGGRNPGPAELERALKLDRGDLARPLYRPVTGSTPSAARSGFAGFRFPGPSTPDVPHRDFGAAYVRRSYQRRPEQIDFRTMVEADIPP